MSAGSVPGRTVGRRRIPIQRRIPTQRGAPIRRGVPNRRRGRLGLSYSVLGFRTLLLLAGAALLLIPLSRQNSPASLVLLVCGPGLLVAVLRPGGPWVTVVLLGALAEWVLASIIVGSPSIARVCGFGLLLFLVHRLASMAAALPAGAELDAVALRRWLLRTAAVVLVSLPLELLALLARPLSGSLLLGVLGALATVGVVVLVAALLHRRQDV